MEGKGGGEGRGKGKRKGREGKGEEEGKGRGRGQGVAAPPPSQISGSAPDSATKSIKRNISTIMVNKELSAHPVSIEINFTAASQGFRATARLSRSF